MGAISDLEPDNAWEAWKNGDRCQLGLRGLVKVHSVDKHGDMPHESRVANVLKADKNGRNLLIKDVPFPALFKLPDFFSVTAGQFVESTDEKYLHTRPQYGLPDDFQKHSDSEFLWRLESYRKELEESKEIEIIVVDDDDEEDKKKREAAVESYLAARSSKNRVEDDDDDDDDDDEGKPLPKKSRTSFKKDGPREPLKVTIALPDSHFPSGHNPRKFRLPRPAQLRPAYTDRVSGTKDGVSVAYTKKRKRQESQSNASERTDPTDNSDSDYDGSD